MTKEIPLTQGKVALVDDEDYEEVSKYKWCADKAKRTFYAQTWGPLDKLVRLHRFLLNPKPDEQCDHINGDGLDNRRCNLRIATKQENSMNQRKLKGNNKYKGVRTIKKLGIWKAEISINYKTLYIGRFSNEEDAARAYDKKAKELFGEYAKLNFPDEEPHPK